MRSARTFRRWLLLPLALQFCISAASVASAVTIDWVTIGDPGNSCETQTQGCFGAVADAYRIAKFAVSNAQYTEFLNAVAATDPNGLYNAFMGTGLGGISGGITQTGTSGSYSYSTIALRENRPVNFVTFWASLRFANWLHNGQPTGAQDNTTTEDGAYTLTSTNPVNDTVARDSGAVVFVPSEDEWYKAAYYKGGGTSAGYWDWPTGSDSLTTCTTPGATANTANCQFAVGDLTDGGSYTGSASPNGTFDQGGNVWEWNEAIIISPFELRGLRGSDALSSGGNMAASDRSNHFPYSTQNTIGFRVASRVPASSPVPSLSPLGITLLLSVLGFSAYRKLHACGYAE